MILGHALLWLSIVGTQYAQKNDDVVVIAIHANRAAANNGDPIPDSLLTTK